MTDFCAARSAWPSQREASAAAQRLNKAKGKALKAFRCHDCGRYHIGREGSSPGSLKGRRPAWDQ
jgi:hypothetical protein